MAFNYNLASGDSSIVLISKVRLEIDDRVSGAGPRPDLSNLTDEEISYYLSGNGSNIYKTAAAICRMLSTAWAGVANITVGPRTEGLGDRTTHYANRAKELDAMAARGKFYAGGLSIDRRDLVEEDTDRIAPAFTRAMDTHP
jgi:hypothetical protein